MSVPPSTATMQDAILQRTTGSKSTAPWPLPRQRGAPTLSPGQYQTGATLPDIPSASSPASPPGSEVATPIAFKVLQLKDDSLLLNASAEQLWLDTRKALGSTYLSVDDYVLLPGQFKYINFRPLETDANYIAVVANFRDPDASTWKQVRRVPPRGEKHALLISFHGRHVAITDERYPPAQSSRSSRKP
ncbi:type VI secretion system lipoprotein TssJ [Azoarcus indigens]|nr:type VI secretion system lipoprotein TssJ [Azoarcus indigens]